MTGEVEINFAAFDVVVPRAIRDDDETRLEVVRLMRVCAWTVNNPKAAGLPDADDEG